MAPVQNNDKRLWQENGEKVDMERPRAVFFSTLLLGPQESKILPFHNSTLFMLFFGTALQP